MGADSENLVEAARKIADLGLSLRPHFERLQEGNHAAPASVHRTYLQVTSRATTPEQEILACLEFADEHHWLPPLAAFIVSWVPVADAAVLRDLLLGPSSKVSASPMDRDLQTLCEGRVCWITGTQVNGTGFLVGPNLVLTAFHTVAAAVPKGRPLKETDIVCRFHRVGREPTPYPQSGLDVPIRLENEWYVAGSPPVAEEVNRHPNLPLKSLAGCDDYALLRLAGSPGRTRGWFTLADAPSLDDKLHLWHRAGGAPIAYAYSCVTQLRSPTTRLRILLDPIAGETCAGASGAPYADSRGEAVAMHHWGRPAQTYPALSRAVRTLPARSVLGTLLPRRHRWLWWVSAEGVTDRLRLGDPNVISPIYLPHVGRTELQESIVLAASPDPAAPKIMHVDGPPGSGRTRSRFMLGTLCMPEHHLVTTVDISVPARDGRPLAEVIHAEAARCAGTYASVSIKPPSRPDYGLIRDYASAWLDRVESLRKGRLVWICVDGLGHHEIASELDRLTLEAVTEEAKRREWLRMMLLGPTPLGSLADYHETITPPDDDEIRRYVADRLGSVELRPRDAGVVEAFVQGVLDAAGPTRPTPTQVVEAVNAVLQRARPDSLASAILVNPW